MTTIKDKLNKLKQLISEIENICEPAPEIPEGFTPWGGGKSCPVNGDDTVEVIFQGSRGRSIGLAVVFPWTLPNTIYAYRLNPKKQEGELWVVIRQMSEKLPIELSLCPTKEQAIHKGKSFVDSYKVLAIKATGIIWQEGDGLELLEEK